jgi:hypothetical protein
MGYAVRPLRRSGQHKAKARAVRHRSYWVPMGGSLQYSVTGDEVMVIGDDSVISLSVTTNTGAGTRPIRYTSPLRAM